MSNFKKFFISFFKSLRSPWAIIIGIITGIIIGLFFKETALSLGFFADIYIKIISLFALPILFFSIVSSLSSLIQNNLGSKLFKFVFLMIIAAFVASLIGILIALVASPGANLTHHQKNSIGRIISQQNSTNVNTIIPDKVVHLNPASKKITENRILNFIPSNIFKAFVNEDLLIIWFFALILGIALGFMDNPKAKQTIAVFDELFQTFLKIIIYFIYGIPFFVCFLLAKQLATAKSWIFFSMFKFMIYYYICAILLIIVQIWFIAKYYKESFYSVLKNLKESMILAIVARRSLVAMPFGLDAFEKMQKVDFKQAKMYFPCYVSLFGFGSTLIMSYQCVFFMQMFHLHFSIFAFWLILFGSVIISFIINNIPLVAGLAFMSIVFTPLGMPLTPAITILLTMVVFLVPAMVIFDYTTNCCLTMYLAKR